MTEKEKMMADAFTSVTGIYCSYCESCKIWQVHCPECDGNSCGHCDCGYKILLDSKQKQLDEMMQTLQREVNDGD